MVSRHKEALAMVPAKSKYDNNLLAKCFASQLQVELLPRRMSNNGYTKLMHATTTNRLG